MFDPGALGTLLIGLDHVRRQQELTDQPQPVQSRPRRRRVVTRPLATSLRRLADFIEPTRPRELGLEV